MENENEMVVKRVSVPLGLEELMETLTKEVLRKKPDDIYMFASEYFARLLSIRNKGNYKTPPTKIRKSQSQSSNGSLPKEYSKHDILKTKSVSSCSSVKPKKELPNPLIVRKINKRDVKAKVDSNLSPRTVQTTNNGRKVQTILEKRKKSVELKKTDQSKPKEVPLTSAKVPPKLKRSDLKCRSTSTSLSSDDASGAKTKSKDEGGELISSKISTPTKEEREEDNKASTSMSIEKAATLIQSLIRGFITRQKLRKDHKSSTIVKDSQVLGEENVIFGGDVKPADKSLEILADGDNYRYKAATKIQSVWRGHRIRKNKKLWASSKSAKEDEIKQGELTPEQRQKAATVIQALFRGYLIRKNVKSTLEVKEKLSTLSEEEEAKDGKTTENIPIIEMSKESDGIDNLENNVRNEGVSITRSETVEEPPVVRQFVSPLIDDKEADSVMTTNLEKDDDKTRLGTEQFKNRPVSKDSTTSVDSVDTVIFSNKSDSKSGDETELPMKQEQIQDQNHNTTKNLDNGVQIEEESRESKKSKEEQIHKQITRYLTTITEPLRRAFSADIPNTPQKSNKMLQERSLSAKEPESPKYIYIPLRQYTEDADNDDNIQRNEHNKSNDVEKIELNESSDLQHTSEDTNEEISHYINSLVEPVKQQFSSKTDTEPRVDVSEKKVEVEPEYQYIPLRNYDEDKEYLLESSNEKQSYGNREEGASKVLNRTVSEQIDDIIHTANEVIKADNGDIKTDDKLVKKRGSSLEGEGEGPMEDSKLISLENTEKSKNGAVEEKMMKDNLQSKAQSLEINEDKNDAGEIQEEKNNNPDTTSADKIDDVENKSEKNNLQPELEEKSKENSLQQKQDTELGFREHHNIELNRSTAEPKETENGEVANSQDIEEKKKVATEINTNNRTKREVSENIEVQENVSNDREEQERLSGAASDVKIEDLGVISEKKSLQPEEVMPKSEVQEKADDESNISSDNDVRIRENELQPSENNNQENSAIYSKSSLDNVGGISTISESQPQGNSKDESSNSDLNLSENHEEQKSKSDMKSDAKIEANERIIEEDIEKKSSAKSEQAASKLVFQEEHDDKSNSSNNDVKEPQSRDMVNEQETAINDENDEKVSENKENKNDNDKQQENESKAPSFDELHLIKTVDEEKSEKKNVEQEPATSNLGFQDAESHILSDDNIKEPHSTDDVKEEVIDQNSETQKAIANNISDQQYSENNADQNVSSKIHSDSTSADKMDEVVEKSEKENLFREPASSKFEEKYDERNTLSSDNVKKTPMENDKDKMVLNEDSSANQTQDNSEKQSSKDNDVSKIHDKQKSHSEPDEKNEVVGENSEKSEEDASKSGFQGKVIDAKSTDDIKEMANDENNPKNMLSVETNTNNELQQSSDGVKEEVKNQDDRKISESIEDENDASQTYDEQKNHSASVDKIEVAGENSERLEEDTSKLGFQGKAIDVKIADNIKEMANDENIKVENMLSVETNTSGELPQSNDGIKEEVKNEGVRKISENIGDENDNMVSETHDEQKNHSASVEKIEVAGENSEKSEEDASKLGFQGKVIEANITDIKPIVNDENIKAGNILSVEANTNGELPQSNDSVKEEVKNQDVRRISENIGDENDVSETHDEQKNHSASVEKIEVAGENSEKSEEDASKSGFQGKVIDAKITDDIKEMANDEDIKAKNMFSVETNTNGELPQSNDGVKEEVKNQDVRRISENIGDENDVIETHDEQKNHSAFVEKNDVAGENSEKSEEDTSKPGFQGNVIDAKITDDIKEMANDEDIKAKNMFSVETNTNVELPQSNDGIKEEVKNQDVRRISEIIGDENDVIETHDEQKNHSAFVEKNDVAGENSEKSEEDTSKPGFQGNVIDAKITDDIKAMANNEDIKAENMFSVEAYTNGELPQSNDSVIEEVKNQYVRRISENIGDENDVSETHDEQKNHSASVEKVEVARENCEKSEEDASKSGFQGKVIDAKTTDDSKAMTNDGNIKAENTLSVEANTNGELPQSNDSVKEEVKNQDVRRISENIGDENDVSETHDEQKNHSTSVEKTEVAEKIADDIKAMTNDENTKAENMFSVETNTKDELPQSNDGVKEEVTNQETHDEQTNHSASVEKIGAAGEKSDKSEDVSKSGFQGKVIDAKIADDIKAMANDENIKAENMFSVETNINGELPQSNDGIKEEVKNQDVRIISENIGDENDESETHDDNGDIKTDDKLVKKRGTSLEGEVEGLIEDSKLVKEKGDGLENQVISLENTEESKNGAVEEKMMKDNFQSKVQTLEINEDKNDAGEIQEEKNNNPDTTSADDVENKSEKSNLQPELEEKSEENGLQQKQDTELGFREQHSVELNRSTAEPNEMENGEVANSQNVEEEKKVATEINTNNRTKREVSENIEVQENVSNDHEEQERHSGAASDVKIEDFGVISEKKSLQSEEVMPKSEVQEKADDESNISSDDAVRIRENELQPSENNNQEYSAIDSKSNSDNIGGISTISESPPEGNYHKANYHKVTTVSENIGDENDVSETHDEQRNHSGSVDKIEVAGENSEKSEEDSSKSGFQGKGINPKITDDIKAMTNDENIKADTILSVEANTNGELPQSKDGVKEEVKNQDVRRISESIVDENDVSETHDEQKNHSAFVEKIEVAGENSKKSEEGASKSGLQGKVIDAKITDDIKEMANDEDIKVENTFSVETNMNSELAASESNNHEKSIIDTKSNSDKVGSESSMSENQSQVNSALDHDQKNNLDITSDLKSEPTDGEKTQKKGLEVEQTTDHSHDTLKEPRGRDNEKDMVNNQNVKTEKSSSPELDNTDNTQTFENNEDQNEPSEVCKETQDKLGFQREHPDESSTSSDDNLKQFRDFETEKIGSIETSSNNINDIQSSKFNEDEICKEEKSQLKSAIGENSKIKNLQPQVDTKAGFVEKQIDGPNISSNGDENESSATNDKEGKEVKSEKSLLEESNTNKTNEIQTSENNEDKNAASKVREEKSEEQGLQEKFDEPNVSSNDSVRVTGIGDSRKEAINNENIEPNTSSLEININSELQTPENNNSENVSNISTNSNKSNAMPSQSQAKSEHLLKDESIETASNKLLEQQKSISEITSDKKIEANETGAEENLETKSGLPEQSNISSDDILKMPENEDCPEGELNNQNDAGKTIFLKEKKNNTTGDLSSEKNKYESDNNIHEELERLSEGPLESESQSHANSENKPSNDEFIGDDTNKLNGNEKSIDRDAKIESNGNIVELCDDELHISSNNNVRNLQNRVDITEVNNQDVEKEMDGLANSEKIEVVKEKSVENSLQPEQVSSNPVFQQKHAAQKRPDINNSSNDNVEEIHLSKKPLLVQISNDSTNEIKDLENTEPNEAVEEKIEKKKLQLEQAVTTSRIQELHDGESNTSFNQDAKQPETRENISEHQEQYGDVLPNDNKKETGNKELEITKMPGEMNYNNVNEEQHLSCNDQQSDTIKNDIVDKPDQMISISKSLSSQNNCEDKILNGEDLEREANEKKELDQTNREEKSDKNILESKKDEVMKDKCVELHGISKEENAEGHIINNREEHTNHVEEKSASESKGLESYNDKSNGISPESNVLNVSDESNQELDISRSQSEICSKNEVSKQKSFQQTCTDTSATKEMLDYTGHDAEKTVSSELNNHNTNEVEIPKSDNETMSENKTSNDEAIKVDVSKIDEEQKGFVQSTSGEKASLNKSVIKEGLEQKNSQLEETALKSGDDKSSTISDIPDSNLKEEHCKISNSTKNSIKEIPVTNTVGEATNDEISVEINGKNTSEVHTLNNNCDRNTSHNSDETSRVAGVNSKNESVNGLKAETIKILGGDNQTFPTEVSQNDTQHESKSDKRQNNESKLDNFENKPSDFEGNTDSINSIDSLTLDTIDNIDLSKHVSESEGLEKHSTVPNRSRKKKSISDEEIFQTLVKSLKFDNENGSKAVEENDVSVATCHPDNDNLAVDGAKERKKRNVDTNLEIQGNHQSSKFKDDDNVGGVNEGNEKMETESETDSISNAAELDRTSQNGEDIAALTHTPLTGTQEASKIVSNATNVAISSSAYDKNSDTIQSGKNSADNEVGSEEQRTEEKKDNCKNAYVSKNLDADLNRPRNGANVSNSSEGCNGKFNVTKSEEKQAATNLYITSFKSKDLALLNDKVKDKFTVYKMENIGFGEDVERTNSVSPIDVNYSTSRSLPSLPEENIVETQPVTDINANIKTNGAEFKGKAEPFYLHQQNNSSPSGAYSQEKAFSKAFTKRPSERYDSVPIRGNLGSSGSSTEETMADDGVSSDPNVLCNISVVESAEPTSAALPLALEMSGAPAGAAPVTSASPSKRRDAHALASTPPSASASGDRADTDQREDQRCGESVVSMDADKRNNSSLVKKTQEQQAATKIQASFRGYQVRKKLKTKSVTNNHPNGIKRSSRRKSSGRVMDANKISAKKPSDLEEQSATKIQAGIRGFLVRRRQKKTTESTPESP